jgi:predicted dehydrogenase
LQLYGRMGGARLAMPDFREEHSLQVITEMGGTLVDVAPAMPQEKGINEYDREIAAFVQSIRTGAPPPATAEQGLTVMRIIDALYRSAATGQETRVS